MEKKERLNTLIEDLIKTEEINKNMSSIKTIKIESPSVQLIEYGFKWGIIETTSDVLAVCKAVPQIEPLLTKMYDEKILKEAKAEARYQQQKNEEIRKYGGVYNSLSEVPGYGTEWNRRCIPDGVVIRGNINGRC